MAKYIGTYANSGDVQTALNEMELNRPFIAYTTDNEGVIFGAAAEKAEAGDIVVYSTGDTLLHYIKQADYSASTYPVADYVPVGVVAYPQNDDAILGPTGEITFIGLNWLDSNNPDAGNAQSQQMIWGYSNYDIPELTDYDNITGASTDMDGKANTQAVLQYATAQTNWKTDSAITFTNAAGYYPLFECAWRYHTSGTVQGDWYVPACGQLYAVFQNENNYNPVNSGFTMVSAGAYPSNDVCGTSTESSSSSAWFGKPGNWSRAGVGKASSWDWQTRPFCSKLMTRI